jgi:TonB family protein
MRSRVLFLGGALLALILTSPTNAQEITLRNVRLEPASGVRTVIGDRAIPAFLLGTLINESDRTFERVEVTLYYRKDEGRIVGEYTTSAVSAGPLAIGDDRSPLRPGYERDFRVPVLNAPSSWDSATVRVDVTEVRAEDGEDESVNDGASALVAMEAEEGDRSASEGFATAPRVLNRDEVSEALGRLYPPILRDAGIGGRVTLQVLVTTEGRVADVRVGESSGHYDLDEAARQVAELTRFSPGLSLIGETMEGWVQYPIPFTVR